ncbi:MAG: YfhO family protein [Candidatus Daviesbacteria bacterium]|nr:YfhO family protein [Candidatus Daviesbacteria bacterium]
MLDKLKSFLPILVIFAIVAVFFYPVWLQGKIPLPGDFVVGVYYPWLDYKWAGYEVGVPVKNPITTDVVSFIFPMQMFAISQLKEGIVPLWNNLILTGTPLMANFQSAPFSPTNFLYFILPKLSAWSWQIFFQPLLAAIFLYLLLREIGRSKLAAIAGGIFFSFAGFMTIWLEWNGHSLVAAAFPLVIFLSIKFLVKEKAWAGLLLPVTLCLQIFSGYPQIILYEFLSLLLLIVIIDFKLLFNFRKMISFGFLILIGLGLAGVQLLPGSELLSNSQRSVETVLNRWAFLPWQLIITFFAPDYFGNHSTYNYWGSADYTLTTGFVGVVVGVLASLGLLFYFKNIYVQFALSLSLISLFIALPNPISIAFKEAGFLGLQAASAHRALILFNLGFAILAAFGVDALLEQKLTLGKISRALYLPGITLLTYFLVTGIIFYFFQYHFLLNDESLKFLANLKVALRNLILPLILLTASGVILLLHYKFSSHGRIKLILVICLIILGVGELFRFGWKFTPFSPPETVFPTTPIIEFLQKQDHYRVMAEDVIPINFLMNYQIETVEGYDAVYPIRYAKFLGVLNSGDVSASPMGRYGSVSNVNSPLLPLANAKYILALKKDLSGKPDPQGNLPAKFKQSFLRPVFSDRSVVVLENTRVLPRAVMFYDWQVEKDEQKALSFLLKLDLSKKLIIDTEMEFSPKVGQGITELIKDTPNQKKIFVSTNQPGLLFISNIFYPGWKAYVDGKLTSIIAADYTFMAIPITTSGDHQILINYDPSSFEWGKIISLVSLGALLGIIICAFWQAKAK